MTTKRLGLIMNGVTGRMGLNQHLIRSIIAIRDQGGVVLANGDRMLPDPILIGRDADKVERLAKRFNVGNERYLEFRAEAFNAFNHPNWAPPGVSLGSPNTFGIITGTVNAPRVIQLALKFYF